MLLLMPVPTLRDDRRIARSRHRRRWNADDDNASRRSEEEKEPLPPGRNMDAVTRVASASTTTRSRLGEAGDMVKEKRDFKHLGAGAPMVIGAPRMA